MPEKKKKPQEDEPTLADVVGGGLAVIQHGIDLVIEKGLKAMDNVGKNANPESIENPTAQKAAKAAKGLARFLGRTGDAYFKAYGKLKNKK